MYSWNTRPLSRDSSATVVDMPETQDQLRYVRVSPFKTETEIHLLDLSHARVPRISFSIEKEHECVATVKRNRISRRRYNNSLCSAESLNIPFLNSRPP
ncbi:hypothetical protein AVEN_7356-1 [Araneus ventricosus]|uniref:Uncharacterized protein n=1 Tax=Araneus ventricosus TaxID=182803 RepID=A0A4Y2BQ94_ARAVE|nr:hypothetical protein AVEN_7356-1 [Araneus ventricosus]